MITERERAVTEEMEKTESAVKQLFLRLGIFAATGALSIYVSLRLFPLIGNKLIIDAHLYLGAQTATVIQSVSFLILVILVWITTFLASIKFTNYLTQ